MFNTKKSEKIIEGLKEPTWEVPVQRHWCSDECTTCVTTTESNIALFRQWLNEDRITDPKKMVTNDMIKRWLGGK